MNRDNDGPDIGVELIKSINFSESASDGSEGIDHVIDVTIDDSAPVPSQLC